MKKYYSKILYLLIFITILYLFKDISTEVKSAVIGSILGIFVFLFLIAYFVLAPRNILICFGKENKMMYIMYNGIFSGWIIFHSSTKDVDENLNILDKEEAIQYNQYRKIRKGFFGMYWIGFPPIAKIYERKQQWSEWKFKETGRKIVFRDEITPYLIMKPFEYVMILKDAEDKNGLPVNLYFTITVMPVHATKPIFGNDDAYGQLSTQSLAIALEFVRGKEFLDLSSDYKSNKLENDLFSNLLRSINEKIPGNEDNNTGIIMMFGYMILSAKIDNAEISGDNKQLKEAVTAPYIAEQNKKIRIANSEAEKIEMENQAAGQEAKNKVTAEFYNRIKNIDGAMKVEERKANSNLTTLVESNSNKKINLSI